jgi:hypothetical protein
LLEKVEKNGIAELTNNDTEELKGISVAYNPETNELKKVKVGEPLPYNRYKTVSQSTKPEPLIVFDERYANQIRAWLVFSHNETAEFIPFLESGKVDTTYPVDFGFTLLKDENDEEGTPLEIVESERYDVMQYSFWYKDSFYILMKDVQYSGRYIKTVLIEWNLITQEYSVIPLGENIRRWYKLDFLPEFQYGYIRRNDNMFSFYDPNNSCGYSINLDHESLSELTEFLEFADFYINNQPIKITENDTSIEIKNLQTNMSYTKAITRPFEIYYNKANGYLKSGDSYFDLLTGNSASPTVVLTTALAFTDKPDLKPSHIVTNHGYFYLKTYSL